MKLAFLISAHTDPQHLLRLVRSLPEESGKYLHIDAKADLRAFSLVAEQPHVHILDKRINVMWGSFLQVDFQRALMKAALSSGMDYDYLITLSGLDYPIWSNEKILHFFGGNRGKEFIQGMRLKDSGTDTKLYQEYRFLNNHAWKYGTLKSKFRVSLRKITYMLGFRKPLDIHFDGMTYSLYKGADWWAVSNDLAKYMLDFYDKYPSFVHYFKNSFSPNETIWQTIAFHSPYAERCILTKGPIKGLEQLTPLTFIDYTNGIKVFTEEDFQMLVDSGKMFCRKTMTGKSDKLMDMIDEYRRI
jgi:hypothetical protein